MSALAAVTSRIGIIATIQPLLFPPAVAAKMAATIDGLSNGRFGINLVTGSFLDEYEQMGVMPPNYAANRYRYAAEWLHVVKRLWAEDSGMSRSMLKIAVRALPRLMITRPLMSHQVRSGWRDDVAVRRAGWAVGHGLSTA